MAVVAALGAPSRAEQLPIKRYTTTDGLAYDVVRRIIPDARGFIWLCTQGALSRFDGYSFRNYGVAEGLPSPSINDLIITRAGEYWIATNGGGVSRLNDRATADAARFTHVAVGGTPQTNRVNVLFEDRDGTLWAGTDGGVFAYDAAHQEFRQVPLEFGEHDDRLVQVWAFAEAHHGSIWIGTKYGLARRDREGRITHRTMASGATDVVHALRADADGSLWVGHEAGLFRLDAGGGMRHYTTADGLVHSDVRALYRSGSGTLWIGTSGGVTSLDRGTFQSFPRAETLSGGIVNAFAEDAAGNLWIGTEAGALRWARTGFVTYDEADGLPHEQIASVFSDAAGAIYVASPNWSISRFDGTRFVAVRPNVPPHLLASLWRQARGVLRDRGGDWWLPASDAIYRFGPVTDLEALARARPKAVYTARDGLHAQDVRRLFEDSHGDIWMADFAPARAPLTRFVRATGQFKRYSDADGLPPFNAIASFAEDRAGGLWMGLREGGVARYAQGRFTVFEAGGTLPRGTVTTLYVDAAGRLWAGVAGPNGGIARVENPTGPTPTFARVKALDAAAIVSVTAIIEDRTGRIYVGTPRGLVVLDTATGRTWEYTTAQGLAAHAIGTSLQDAHGALWLGTPRGLSYFEPQPMPPAPVPNVFIVGLTVAGTPVPISELGETAAAPIDLTAAQNHVQVEYVGLAPGTDRALRYQYKLDGETDWSAPTVSRSVTYAKLAPGRFRFTVRAITGEGSVSAQPATVTFTIAAPVWRRWWFLALVGVAAAAATVAAYRYRVRRLLALERIRTRIASDLHDDLGSSLSQIAILSEVAGRLSDTGRGAVDKPLARIADLSREALDAIGDIVWAIDPQKDRFANLAQRMRRVAEDFAAARDIDLEFHAAGESGHNLPLAADVRREVYLVFKEAIKNAARHSACRRLTVSLQTARGIVVLTVSDDGRGFDPSVRAEGHGLESLRRRAAALKGTLAVESAPGEGTRLRLSVPSAPPRR